jgi:hypothetical protein
MPKKRIIVALIYDFDGTLSPHNMQDGDLLKSLGYEKYQTFWDENKKFSVDKDASSILSYMYLMVKKAKEEGLCLKKDDLKKFGENVQLFDGVVSWFKLINSYSHKIGVKIKHYINSSGLTEMIEGTSIVGEFEKIFACSFIYDEYEAPL